MGRLLINVFAARLLSPLKLEILKLEIKQGVYFRPEKIHGNLLKMSRSADHSTNCLQSRTCFGWA
jgi:hypothetical protein